MTDDGKEYEYVYDAFGRLRKIKNTSTQALVSEYWYNGLGHRITWHADTTRSGGGAPDGSVNTDDPKVHFVYNERWQQVAAYRQANGSGVDTHPKEQFVHHNAGHGGYGGGSYIDAVIPRDDHEDDWARTSSWYAPASLCNAQRRPLAKGPKHYTPAGTSLEATQCM